MTGFKFPDTETDATGQPERYETDLIDRDEVRRLMGDPSVSTLYADAEIRAFAIPMTAPGRQTKMVRWVRGDILELRGQRIAKARENAEAVRQEVLARNERRREKRRQQQQQREA